MLVQHLQGQLVPRAEADLPGHPGLLPPLAVGGPLPGQVEPDIHQGVLAAGGVTEVDADLAVVDLAQAATPLPLHAHRRGPLLGKGGGVEDQHRVGLRQFGPHLPSQLGQQGTVVPVGLADELLQALALAVMQVGARLGILAGQVGEQALDIVAGIGTLLRRVQGLDKRLQEGFQAGQDSPQQAGWDLGIVQQFLQAEAIASLHGSSSRQA